MSVIGRIHSFESCGTVDGPGIRFITFFQGCLMRCLYCHNRDTWDTHGGKEVTVEDLMKEVVTYRHFMNASGGGVTASGGEAILQAEFVRDWFRACKKEGIHTCLDTSGIMFPGGGGTSEEERERLKKVDLLLSVTDLVMLDIKHMDAAEHRKLTGQDNEKILAFARYLDEKQIPVWIRHVVVPGITFQREELEALGRFLATLSNVEKLEVLPYHSMGKVKYDNLGIDYALKDTPQLTKAEAKSAESIILEAMRQARNV